MRRLVWLTLAVGLAGCEVEQPLEPPPGPDSAPLSIQMSLTSSSVTLTPLGAPSGWTDSFAEGVNSGGLGVGWASGGSPSFVGAVFGTPVQVVPPLIAPGVAAIQAFSINDAQVVTGAEAFFYSVGNTGATRLPTLAGEYTGFSEVGYDISNAGDIVGVSRLAASPQFPRAVLWRSGSGYTAVDLGVPAGAPALLPSEARSIAPNLSGANVIVAGYTESCVGTPGCIIETWGARHAFIWRDGTMSLLPIVPGAVPGSEAYGIADNGMVVGLAQGKGAILWDGEGVIELAPACGALFSLTSPPSVGRAIALTNATPSRVLIVGDCNGQPVVWFDNGTCGYQAELLPLLTGDTDGTARDVNSSGQIVGYTRATSASGPAHAVRWSFSPPAVSSECSGESDETPAEAIGNLRALLATLEISKGTASSLDAKLRAALQALDEGNTALACAELQDFINHAQAQSGKHISEAAANDLIAEATAIRTALGC